MGDKEGEQPMIAFDFEYYKPSTVAEAIETFNEISKQDEEGHLLFRRYGVYYVCTSK